MAKRTKGILIAVVAFAVAAALVTEAYRLIARRAMTERVTTQAAATLPHRPEPIVAIWFENGGRGFLAPSESLQQLIVGVWSDGTVIWSEDRETGGPPYLCGKADPAVAQGVMRDLEAIGFFDEERQVHFGPDASHTVMAAESGQKRQWIGTWHDPPPSNPNAVVTQHGIEAVQPGQAPTPLSPEYRQFVEMWAKARQAVERLVPASGKTIEGLDESVFDLGRPR